MQPSIPGNVFPRTLDHPLPRVRSARGLWVEDSHGRRYLDASGGAIVMNVGHGREAVARAVYDQIMLSDYAHPTLFTTPVVEELAAGLTRHAPPGIERFYFVSSGSEATETAIKLARQIHLDAGRPHRQRLIARWKSYHGLSLGALSTMGRTAFRAPYAPMLGNVEHIPPPYCLRCSFGLSYPACGCRCALILEETIQNLGPDTVSAFVAETVSGGSLAMVAPPPEYFRIIREICDRYDVLLILDEVMCGLGRTGRWFACQHFDLTPDLVTIGKGLGGGAVPIAAVGVQSRHFDTICRGGANFVHGGTFTHHGPSAAAGVAVLDILEREDLVARVAAKGPLLGAKLKARLAGHPHVADVRGMGFFWGLEFVEDRKTLAPFERSRRIVEKLWTHIFEQGVLLYRATGMCGLDGDALLIGPAFTLSDEQMDTIADAIGRALHDILG